MRRRLFIALLFAALVALAALGLVLRVARTAAAY
jgi:predicted small integral membrane protein